MAKRVKKFKPTMPRPKGFMTSALPGPCPTCKYEWGATLLDTSDEEAEEWPMTFVCARCHKPVDDTFDIAGAAGSAEP